MSAHVGLAEQPEKSKSAKNKKKVKYKLALLENVESDHCLEFTCKSIIAAASICSFDLAPFSLDAFCLQI